MGMGDNEVESIRAQLEKSREELGNILSIASCVQRSMLPHWSRISDVYSYACRILPLSEISGDLLEWYRPTEETSLVILGDVSGHGAKAALAMTAIQAFLKQFKHVDVETARRIHFIATLVHEFILKNLRDIAYMSATLVFVDFANRTLRYLNCGNPEPFLARLGDGSRRVVNPNGIGCTPLGLMPEAKYTARDVVETDFAPGDACILYSDGLMDVASDASGRNCLRPGAVEELCSTTIRAQSPDEATFCELPYRLLVAQSEMGFTHRQDDITICAFTPFEPPDGLVYRARVRMRPENIDEACHKAAEWVAKRFRSEELGVKTDLLLNEYLMNIHRHGYDAFRRQREVSILAIRELDGKMQVAVWDRGFPWDAIASASQAEAEAKLERQNDSLAGSGRGQAIMFMLCEQIRRERVGDLNRTIFDIALP